MRPRCSVFIATSLDGYIARRDGGIDWLSIVESPGEDYGYARFFADVDALFLGRRTYETVLAFPTWPYGDKRCVVFTHGARESRHGEEFHAGPPGPMLEELHAAGVRRIYVDGGALIRSFLREDLIDDITLSIVPVLLGDGIPLFAWGAGELRSPRTIAGGSGPFEGPDSIDTTVPSRRLRLAGSQGFPSGLVQLRYDIIRS